MPRNGKLVVGEDLEDPGAPAGTVTVVVAITTGRLHTPIDLRAPRWGSSAESCALHGGSAHHDAQLPAHGAGKKGHL